MGIALTNLQPLIPKHSALLPYTSFSPGSPCVQHNSTITIAPLYFSLNKTQHSPFCVCSVYFLFDGNHPYQLQTQIPPLFSSNQLHHATFLPHQSSTTHSTRSIPTPIKTLQPDSPSAYTYFQETRHFQQTNLHPYFPKMLR